MPDAGSCLNATAGGGWKPIAPSPRGFSFSTLSFDGGTLAATAGMTIARLDEHLQVLSSETTTFQAGGWSEPQLHALTDGIVAHAVSTFVSDGTRSLGALIRLGEDGMPLRGSDGGYEATSTFSLETPNFHQVYLRTAVSADGSELLIVYGVVESNAPPRSILGLRVRRDGSVVSGPTELMRLGPDTEMLEFIPLSIAVVGNGVIVAAVERLGGVAAERLVLQRFAADWIPEGVPRVLDVPYATLPELIPPANPAEGDSTADVSVLLRWTDPMELRTWARVFDGGVPETFWAPSAGDGNPILWATAQRHEFGLEVVWIETRYQSPDAPRFARIWSQPEGSLPVELTVATGPIPIATSWRPLAVSRLGPRDRAVFTTTSRDVGEMDMLEGLKYCIP